MNIQFAFVVWTIFSQISVAWGFAMPESVKISNSVANADAVVVAQMENFIVDPSYKKLSASESYFGQEGFIEMKTLEPPGQGTFRVLRTLRGQTKKVLTVQLPRVLSSYYSEEKLPIQEKSIFILILKDKNGVFTPVDPTIPIIMLASADKAFNTETLSTNVEASVYELMIKSTVDPVLRGANIYLLRSIKHPFISKSLLNYMNDPDLNVRDDALYGLAINGRIEAIKPIANLEQDVLEKTGKGISAVGALEKYDSPQSVPYLNPLLFEISQYTRLNSMASLQKTADMSSVPYLMLALFDPETQNVVGYSAYRTLHRLVPALGRPRDPGYFEVRREAETARVMQWWQDELSGKHPKLTLEASKPTIEFSPLPLEKLNVLLFDPSTVTREKAMAELEKRADTSSIPYLILALYDPSEKVAFEAYTKLHQLIPKLPAAKDQVFFVAQRQKALLPVFDWWEDELLGRHIQRVKVSSQISPSQQGSKLSQVKPPTQRKLMATQSRKVEPVKVEAKSQQKSPFTQIALWSGVSLVSGISSLALVRKFC